VTSDLVRPATRLSTELIGHFRSLEMTRSKMEQLLVQGAIVRRDIEQVYAGLYLDALTQFELLLETLFLGLVTSRIASGFPGFGNRVPTMSDRVARSVVLGPRPYVDWLPYDNTEERAEVYFNHGLPFTSLSDADKSQLSRIQFTRNAIAHKSRYSKRRFESSVIAGATLMRRERTPTGYLRSVYRSAPTENRYQEFVGHMSGIAMRLCQ